MTRPINDIAEIAPEVRGRLTRMMKSREFCLLIDTIFIPYLEYCTKMLDNPQLNERDTQVVRGEKKGVKKILDLCCKLANIDSLFDSRQAVMIDLSKLDSQPVEESDSFDEIDNANDDVDDVVNRRPFFPA